MHCGIEFEYLLIDTEGPEPGRIRDFSNLPFSQIHPLLEDKPGRDDPELATGDLGIKSGYWYLEGDERFHPDGRFRTLEVKGVEIRTPPAPSVPLALQQLLQIEVQLAVLLARHGLGLAIAGFNPVRPGYGFEPPLNPWEQALRRAHRAYDGAHISTLSYGPDINLSMPGWSPSQNLEVTRKLNYYAPYLVPFSFSSPFAGGGVWPGWSRRTFERARLRPAVKLFLTPPGLAQLSPHSQLVHPARLAREGGRIEFKAFDAMPSLELLQACCYLLVGVCLSRELPGSSETADLDLYQRAALSGFQDPGVEAGAQEVLTRARTALMKEGDGDGAAALGPLERLLAARRTPAQDLLEIWRENGLMYKPGGHARYA